MTRAGVYRFGDFQLDWGARQLCRGAEAIHLSPKALELLHALLEAAPSAVSKADLQERIWPDTFVVEANLQHLVAEVRRALGDNRRNPRFVRTVFSFGYSFQESPATGESRHRPSVICRLSWDGAGITLAGGEYTIGRDATADIVLDSGSVSRQHARLLVTGAAVEIEDLNSKNGTFLRGRRVKGPVPLKDGDGLRFGAVPVMVRIGRAGITDTVIADAPANLD